MNRFQTKRIRFALLGSTWGIWDRRLQTWVRHPGMDVLRWHTDSRRKAIRMADYLNA